MARSFPWVEARGSKRIFQELYQALECLREKAQLGAEADSRARLTRRPRIRAWSWGKSAPAAAMTQVVDGPERGGESDVFNVNCASSMLFWFQCRP